MKSKLKKAIGGAKQKRTKIKKRKSTASPTEDASGKPPSRSRRRRQNDPSRKANKSAPKVTGEPDAIRAAREQIREMLTAITLGRPPLAIGLVLAIVNQETGNAVGANALIDEFKLDKVFGLKRF